MDLWDLYVEALDMKRQLETELARARFASVDDAWIVARDELARFIEDYEAMRVKWYDGFSAVYQAGLVLEIAN